MNSVGQYYLGQAVNNGVYGSNSDANPNNANNPNWTNPPKAQAVAGGQQPAPADNPNRGMGQVVPQNAIQDQSGMQPNTPNMLPPNQTNTTTAGNLGPGSSGGGGYNYDFSKNGSQNAFNYMGQGIGPSLDMAKGNGGAVATKQVDDYASQVRDKGHSGF